MEGGRLRILLLPVEEEKGINQRLDTFIDAHARPYDRPVGRSLTS